MVFSDPVGGAGGGGAVDPRLSARGRGGDQRVVGGIVLTFRTPLRQICCKMELNAGMFRV